MFEKPLSRKKPGFGVFLLVLFSLSSVSCTNKAISYDPESFKNVLMVGNSLTYTYDLPSQIETLAADLGADPGITTVGATAPDVGLIHHTSPEYSNTLELVRSGEFEIVVVQGNSMETCQDPERFIQNVGILAQEIDKNGGELILFETWAPHPDGFTPIEKALYEKEWTGGSQQAMQAKIRDVYARAAIETKAKVARVGDAWEIVQERFPDIELYRPDGGHPTEHGSYLAACVIVSAVTDIDPQMAEWKPEAVSRKEASLLRQTAYEVGSGGTLGRKNDG